MSQDQRRPDQVKGSNLGMIFGILVVVAVTMLLLNTSFMQDKLGKKSKEDVIEETKVGGFEYIEEPEITLLDEVSEDEEVEIVSEINILDTHEPVDTAIGDVNMALVSGMLLSGSGLLLMASKRLAK